LVKRRQALLESLSSRNSQLETHPKDEQEASVLTVGASIVRIDFLMPLKLIKKSRRAAASFFQAFTSAP
jgi:hypothetical protein